MSSDTAWVNDSAPITTLQLLEALSREARATVVTPNRRLAVTLKAQFDATERRAGHAAWATPDILPLASFLERCYRALSLRGASVAQPQLLDIAQSQLLWEQVVRASDIASHLMSVAQTARQAAAAWSVAQAWELLPAMRRFVLSEDAEIFFGWAQRFQERCRERDVIDAAVIPAIITTWMQEAAGKKLDFAELLPRQLFMAGFDIITPQQQHFLDACEVLGVPVRRVLPLGVGAEVQCRRLQFATEDAELRGCAAWARKRLLSDPAQRIGVVVPDLRARRGDIARALTDALQPGVRAQVLRAPSGVASGFNISLGFPLNEYALVHDALGFIELSLNRPITFLRISALLRSPFIAGASSEIGPRARLDAALREVVGPQMNLFALQRKLKLGHQRALTHAALICPTLLALIDRVAGIVGPTTSPTATRGATARKPSPRDWSRYFGQVLLAWGFPGEDTLDSSDYQVMEKFRDALATLATLEILQPRMRADEALNQLRNIVANTVFQPEVAQDDDAPIQVLGILESSGQTFDALWVTGLTEEAWPLQARPNPFIPAALQRAAGVTEASAAASHALDEHITNGWRVAAPEVVFSHAEKGNGSQSGEQPRIASALTRDIALSEISTLTADSRATDYAHALYAMRTRELIPDAPMVPLPAPTKVGGGAALLRDQAACPFRAFARHRLGAVKLGTPQVGLDAAERGTLLHRVMSLLWTRIETQRRLMAMDEIAIKQLVNETVEKAIVETHAKGADNLTGRFAAIEHARLSRLIIAWLGYEMERTPFEVRACEEAREITLSGLTMQLRLDRLDRLADGTHALIDYKTGVAKVASWLGDRPDEPQLPLYFHTSEEAVSVLAFARVKRGARGKVFGFEGVSAIADLLPDVEPIEQKYGMEKKGYLSWDVLVAQWENSLNALVKNFVDGDAQVDPKNGNLTCAQCELQSICRISELIATPLPDDDIAESAVDANPDAFDE